MRQNPIWILLSEVRSGEAVMSVRNAISSGHNILSTIHADKASSIPLRMYSLMESSQDVEQFLNTIHRYVQIGVYVKGYFSKKFNRFQREIIEVCEFYVDENNKPCTNEIYKKALDGHYSLKNPTQHLLDYLSIQNVFLDKDTFHIGNNKEYDGDIESDLKKYHEEKAAAGNVNVSASSTNNLSSQTTSTQTSNVTNQNANTASPVTSNQNTGVPEAALNNATNQVKQDQIAGQPNNLNGVGVAHNTNFTNNLKEMQPNPTNLHNTPKNYDNGISNQTVASNPVSQISNPNTSFNDSSLSKNGTISSNPSSEEEVL